MEIESHFKDICNLREKTKDLGPLRSTSLEAGKYQESLSKLANELSLNFLENNWCTKISKGAGWFPKIPWVGLLPPSQSVSSGVYVSVCFGKDGNGAVVGCAHSVTNPKFPEDKIVIRKKRGLTPEVDVDGTRKEAEYNNSYINPKEFFRDSFNEAEFLEHIKESIKLCAEYLNIEFNEVAVNMSKLPKPFLLLAGISGTGKTRFVREQAKASTESFNLVEGENYCLVPVRPDWHEPSDLLGYVSRIGGTRYIATDFLKFMVKALVASVESVTADKITWKNPTEIPPYWLCLDEMNLAPVEQYFADYLSILETRKWDENKQYSSKPMLKPQVLSELPVEARLKLFKSLELYSQPESINSFSFDAFKAFLSENQSLAENTVKTYLRSFKKVLTFYADQNSLSDFDLFKLSVSEAREIIDKFSRSNKNEEDPYRQFALELNDRNQNGDCSAVCGKFVDFCDQLSSTVRGVTNSLTAYILKNGIPLPPNLIVAGTVNMDETTHGFSRKVIDRALTLDFQEFFPNDFDTFFGKQVEPEVFGFPTVSDARSVDYIPYKDEDGKDVKVQEETQKFLTSLNNILKNTPFELAYRALNEILLAVHCFKPDSREKLEAVWDDFLMQKVLPRIEGDSQKLKSLSKADIPDDKLKGSADFYGKGTLLHQLYNHLSKELSTIWGEELQKEKEPEISEETTRPDLLRKDSRCYCRSKKKLLWMMKRLKANHFTDFWV